MAISTRIQAYLQSVDTNATRLAKDLGISQSGFNRIVKGESMPSYKVMEALSRTNVNLNWLFLGEGNMFRSNTLTGGNTASLPAEMHYLRRQIQIMENQLEDKERLIQLLYEHLK